MMKLESNPVQLVVGSRTLSACSNITQISLRVEKGVCVCACVCVCVCVCMCRRKRETDRQTERQRERQREHEDCSQSLTSGLCIAKKSLLPSDPPISQPVEPSNNGTTEDILETKLHRTKQFNAHSHTDRQTDKQRRPKTNNFRKTRFGMMPTGESFGLKGMQD